MRLWHKDLIPILPRQQLLGQWRELFAIYHDLLKEKKGEKKKTAFAHRHPLVNYVNNYGIDHLLSYGLLILSEFEIRGYKASQNLINEIQTNSPVKLNLIFDLDHTDEYLEICYYNLKEKYMRGLIVPEAWKKIENKWNILKEKTA